MNRGSAPAPGRTWIAWETQRRSLELSRRLGADLKLCLHDGWGRFPRCARETIGLLAKRRGETVFVQNPSMVLAALAGLLKGPLGFRLVVDRHSNFSHLAGKGAGLKRRLSDRLSDFTLRRADLTIVTNGQLARHVEKAGGRAFVLQDPFPDLSAWSREAMAAEAAGAEAAGAEAGGVGVEAAGSEAWGAEVAKKDRLGTEAIGHKVTGNKVKGQEVQGNGVMGQEVPARRIMGSESELSGTPSKVRRAPYEILFVSSWAFDEPIAATLEACRRLQGEVIVRITGRVPAGYARLLRAAPVNFITTGFLSEEEYFSRMAQADAVLAVTHREATLVCGGYEGAALGKPLILGDSETLRAYFDAGAVYTDGSARDLECRIRDLISDLPAYRRSIRDWHARRAAEWSDRLEALERILAGSANAVVAASASTAPTAPTASAEPAGTYAAALSN